jgi:hypothetical protein
MGVLDMSVSAAALYYQLGSLIAQTPELSDPADTQADAWIERARELVELAGGLADKIQLRVATENLDGMLRARNAQTIRAIVQRALVNAERNVPPPMQGAFIVANNAFDAFAAVRKVLANAEAEVLLVDPNADGKALTDVAVLAPDQVAVRLLADRARRKKTLTNASRRWRQQFGSLRPLFVHLADPDVVRDTLILVDGAKAWASSQPFGQIARFNGTTLVRIPGEAARTLIADYAAKWDAAEPFGLE